MFADQRRAYHGGRLGIIGGVGPVATTVFYQRLTKRVSDMTGALPDLVIHSQPQDLDLIGAVLSGSLTTRDEARISTLLDKALNVLDRAGCDLVAMPCNSYHRYLRPLLAGRTTPFVDMIEATLEHASRRGLRRLVLLATGTSVNHDAYQLAEQHGIQLVPPARPRVATELIERCVGGRAAGLDRSTMLAVLGDDARADGVLLGCTDLTVLRADLEPLVPVVDSLECLVESCAEALTSSLACADTGALA